MPSPNSQQGAHLTTKISALLPLGAAIVAIAVGWGELKTMVENEEKFREDFLKSQDKFQAQVEEDSTKLEDRIRYLESQGARMDERFNLILQGVTELKTQIGELSGKDRK